MSSRFQGKYALLENVPCRINLTFLIGSYIRHPLECNEWKKKGSSIEERVKKIIASS